MEAVARYDFTGRSPREMSFKKGSILIVKIQSGKGDHQEWLTAEQGGREGLVPANHVTMKPHEWYHGHMTRHEAEHLLKDEKHDGTFLIRESESNPGDFSLSVKFTEGVQHFKISRDGAGKYSVWLVRFPSLNELVDYHRRPSVGKTLQLLLADAVPNRPKMLALWDFKPTEEGMLPFDKGDVIFLLDKTTHRDWWKGEKDGFQGIFPKNYVKVKDVD